MYKIGIFGSETDPDHQTQIKLDKLVESLAKYKENITLVTGACPGVPLHVAREASNLGIEVWGFSPSTDRETHINTFPRDNINVYDRVFYVPPFYKFSGNIWASYCYRNLVSTSHCHAGIICEGRWGTLNEFTNLIEMGKVIGVYESTGGIADELREFSKSVKKEIRGEIIFEPEPSIMVQRIIDSITEKNINPPDL